jgi:cell division protease FtsH
MMARRLVLGLALFVVSIFVANFASDRMSRGVELTYGELIHAVDSGQVSSLKISEGESVRGTRTHGGNFYVYLGADSEDLVRRAQLAGVQTISFSAPSRQFFRLTDLISLLFLGLLMAVILRSSDGPNSGSVGQQIESQVTFGDVKGADGAVEELSQMVRLLTSPDDFARLGARVPKGALMTGPPGTGKTLLARAVAGEADLPFYVLSGSEVTGFIVGLGSHRIKSIFKRARKTGGVIFIDEIDALGGVRGRSSSHNEDDRTLNQLLVEMDGFDPSDRVVVLAATNRPETLDAALMRPGRFDRVISVGVPDVTGREQILAVHVLGKKVPLSADVDLHALAKLTPGSSGAELAQLVNEAAIVAGVEQSESVGWQHFEQARDRQLLGKERKGFRAPDSEWNTVAYHEAGHALVGVLCCAEDGLHKVTIQPRGHAMGVAFFAPDGDRNLYSRSHLRGMIMKGFGGRAAEEIIFGSDRVTSGAKQDLIQVNRVAREMVYSLGMGKRFLVHDPDSAPLSGEAHASMDREVDEMLRELYEETVEVVKQNRAGLVALADALLERETVSGDDARAIIMKHAEYVDV